jgi:hypothetical protein
MVSSIDQQAPTRGSSRRACPQLRSIEHADDREKVGSYASGDGGGGNVGERVRGGCVNGSCSCGAFRALLGGAVPVPVPILALAPAFGYGRTTGV